MVCLILLIFFEDESATHLSAYEEDVVFNVVNIF